MSRKIVGLMLFLLLFVLVLPAAATVGDYQLSYEGGASCSSSSIYLPLREVIEVTALSPYTFTVSVNGVVIGSSSDTQIVGSYDSFYNAGVTFDSAVILPYTYQYNLTQEDVLAQATAVCNEEEGEPSVTVSYQRTAPVTPETPAPPVTGGGETATQVPSSGSVTVPQIPSPSVPSGFVLRTITCDTPVYDRAGGQPVGSNRLVNGSTWFVNPTAAQSSDGQSWTAVFTGGFRNGYVPTTCVG